MEGWECCKKKYEWSTPQCIICGTVHVGFTTPCMVCKLLIVREANYCPHCKSPQDETLFPFSINAECAAANLEMQRVRDTCAAYSGKSMHIGGSALTHSSERTVQVLLSVSKAKKLSSERLYLRAVDALVGRLGLGDPWTKNRSKTERTDCANHIRLVQETYEGKQAANVAAIRSSNLELLVSRGFNVDHIDKSKLNMQPAVLTKMCDDGDVGLLKKKHRPEAKHTAKAQVKVNPPVAHPITNVERIDPLI